MFKKLIYVISFVLVLGLVGSASAAVVYSDSFDRPDSPTVGTNDNALGGIISAPWVEVETDETHNQIFGNTLVSDSGNCNCYIDHKFTGAELLTSFTVEFDVMPTPQSNIWFALEFGPGPESFTTGIDVNQNRTTLGFLMRPQISFIIWDGSTKVGTNDSDIIDNLSNPARVRLKIDSPDGYSDGNIATVRVWINDTLVENLFGTGDSYDFTWDGHTDGVYISFENNGANKSIDNLVIADSFGPTPSFMPFKPSPADKATDVLREVILSWKPGEFADQHDVYFGESFEDINDATTDSAVYQGRQSETTYALDRLDLGQTYYWRVDEVNAPPDYTIFKGDVWSFTVEPYAYPIENITVTASSANKADEGPENTINGSGLDDDDLHSTENTAMWLSSGIDPNATWIQYEFDRIHKLYQMLVWNYNSSVEPLVGFGIKEATIEYSVDGTNWVILGTAHEFAQGPGAAGYAHNTTVDLSGISAKYVKITANSNWGGMLNQYGLSEVRFFYVPVWATEPSPDSGATDVGVDTIFSFKAGREAASHDVYLSTDEQAVIDGNVPVASVTEPSYAPSLDLAGTYYWRIDEVNVTEIPTTWQGDIWNLSTQEYLVVDDFESYNDIPAGQEGSNLVYGTWADGFENPANGSTIGYNEPFQPTIETSIVYDGQQSVPLFYDNTAATYSEVTANVADLQADRNWTEHGIKALTLRFSGDPNNILQQMYVKINGSKVTYDGSAEDTRLKGWQMWYIDLASLGVSLSNVTELSIGFERIGAVGGQGMVLLDGIRLYSYDRQLITPADPGTTGLQAHYEFEGNTNDSSGNARNGTAMGSPTFVAGKIGQAINLRGLNDYVEITGYKGILGPNAVTVTAWVKTVSMDTGAIVGWGPNIAGERFGFRVDVGRLRLEHQGGNIQGDTLVNDGGWHHVAVTVQENATISYPEVILYLDGTDDTRPTTDPDAFNLTAGEDVSIGRRPSNNDRFFLGQIDDIRIYERALSPEEIAGSAGRTTPFDKTF